MSGSSVAFPDQTTYVEGAGRRPAERRMGVDEVAHTAICDVCDVVVEHGTEVEANGWAFVHAREVHGTVLEEVDVIDLPDGQTETFLWPRNLALAADAEKAAMVRIGRRASTTSYAFMRKVRSP